MTSSKVFLPLLLILLFAVSVAPGCKKQREKKANYTYTTTGDKDTTVTGKARLFFSQTNVFGIKFQELSVELVGEGSDYFELNFYSSNDDIVLVERKFFVGGSSNYTVSVNAFIDGAQLTVDTSLPGYVEITKASNTRVDGNFSFTMHGIWGTLEISGSFEAYDY